MRQPPPENETDLDDLLTEPGEESIAAVQQLGGDVLILGAGGKMGPTLAVLAQRSIQAAGLPIKVRCASRFSSDRAAQALADAGIEIIHTDLLQPGAVEALPDAPNVAYLLGMKFGATGAEPLTWMLNSFVPGLVARRFASSRIVALSTGNVYPLVPVAGGGATENVPVDPIGDYAQSCVGRERLFQYGSEAFGTPVALVRLNYANDLRYGVLHDVARKVFAGEPIELSNGHVNVVWQGDANRVVLQAFSICASPARALNLTGPETVSIRWLAEQFGARMGRTPIFTGSESACALLSNAAECHRLFGYPRVTLGEMIDWTAGWVLAGGRSLSRPTHFETRDGRF